MNIRYGKKTVTKTDESGTTTETTEYIKGGNAMARFKETVTEQKFVMGALEEIAVIQSFARRYHDDKTMLDPTVTIVGDRENPKGYRVDTTYSRYYNS
mgnify:CR=1 FL=1